MSTREERDFILSEMQSLREYIQKQEDEGKPRTEEEWKIYKADFEVLQMWEKKLRRMT